VRAAGARRGVGVAMGPSGGSGTARCSSSGRSTDVEVVTAAFGWCRGPWSPRSRWCSFAAGGAFPTPAARLGAVGRIHRRVAARPGRGPPRFGEACHPTRVRARCTPVSPSRDGGGGTNRPRDLRGRGRRAWERPSDRPGASRSTSSCWLSSDTDADGAVHEGRGPGSHSPCDGDPARVLACRTGCSIISTPGTTRG